MSATPSVLPSKVHYQVLDGLRGVAALIVVAFHIFEPWSDGDHTRQILNHGYLAVDFFFLLSGFVVAYAYDDRWATMTQWEFYKRRLVRLQPMIVLGSIIGAALFYLGTGPVFPLIGGTPVWKVLLVMCVGFTLLPLPVSADIRGWSEMHPLDGPAWSLFFEYIANILYAIGIRKLPRRALGALVALSALYLIHLAVTSRHGDVIGGWSLQPAQLHVGFARLLYPFFAGMLLMRSGWRIHTRHAFTLCSVLLAVVLCFPRVGGTTHLWVNGIYDAFSIIVLFPLIIAIGAGNGVGSARDSGGESLGNTAEVSRGDIAANLRGNTAANSLGITAASGAAADTAGSAADPASDSLSHRIPAFLGGISYPLYITHYPLIYAYYAWVLPHHIAPAPGGLAGILLYLMALAIAYASLKLYDEPIRRWLTRRFLSQRS